MNAPKRGELDELMRAAVAGNTLAPETVMELEQRLEQAPADLPTRAKLLGHYFRARFASDEAGQAFSRHVLWLIEHHPEAPLAGSGFATPIAEMEPALYDRASSLWRAHVDARGRDVRILENAARFFILSDSRFAEELLKRAQGLEPRNPHWLDELGHLYGLRSRPWDTEEKRLAAQASLAAYEQALELADDTQLAEALLHVVKAAADAQEWSKAQSYARELLEMARPSEPGWDDCLHAGNTVLGRAALLAGDVEAAKAHLLDSARVNGSPVLGSFGPSMRLAKELLEAGEREVVAEYLGQCRRFWKMGEEELNQWEEVISEGGMTDFRPNRLR